jgi:hypothetical protein
VAPEGKYSGVAAVAKEIMLKEGPAGFFKVMDGQEARRPRRRPRQSPPP